MEYNRLVAYIYSYNSGLKNRNIGFARMEIRNDNIKMSINMRNAIVEGYSIWGVYLFYRDGDDVCGIKLGEMTLGGGASEFTYNGSALNIENSEKNFEDIRGLFLISGGNKSYVFASEWDDEGFAPERILLERRKIELRKEPVVNSVDIEGEEAEYKVAEQIEMPEQLDEPEQPEENIIYEEPDNSPELEQMWELISDRREKMYIFADDELYDVIEINPDDIDKMPNTNWHLRNNSFVNHGYFSFRHLIAGRNHADDGTGFFIGVPGIYNRRERNLASMYGFNRFKFSMRSDMRLNQFGYWYRDITD